jgi:hypothetical protein
MTQPERQRPKDGNRALDATIQMINLCNKYGVPFILENPASPYLWHDPELFETLGAARHFRFHQCAFGARWKKETRISCGDF